ncbi:hypothetical protein [Desulfovibrio ferrophilus]|uniref:Uncharacterized protein n=1 Tax=Desulfovibrio ferrophilus TaxID=241368 RepID=A0A2Z6AU57_9BACT|nr:hypothetical protein [Desulfovibrio ferrophilus]BBD06759.1 hypothetical protein DFE_0033 [Desulfovibrio ferrophilus]
MMLPQDEARFKYCPLLKTSDDKFRMCQGDQCMMWRFKDPEKKGEGDEGYCGLAGKPMGA